MHIKNIRLSNFRGFKELSLDLDEKFNIIVGINGTGKTSVLEGLKIAAGSLMIGMDKVKDHLYSPGIDKKYDVRVDNFNPQWPVVVSADGNVLGKDITWSRSLSGSNNSTTTKDANSIRHFSDIIKDEVKTGKTDLILPLIAYFSIDRFKLNRGISKGIEPSGSRLRGYYNSLDDQTNFQFFANLFRTQTYAELQQKKEAVMLNSVKDTIRTCIHDCVDFYHDVSIDEMAMKFSDGRVLPYHLLSEGVRITLSTVMEIAFRCYLLNDHLGSEAAKKTNGIVLIDEIDLHLHPEWQMKVAEDFRVAFPEIQFVVTTHSPLVLGSLKSGKIFTLKDFKSYQMPLQYGKDANYILLKMEAEARRREVRELLEKYYLLIEAGQGKEDEAKSLRAELETLIGKSDSELQNADVLLSFFK